MVPQAEVEKIKSVCSQLYDASVSIRVLTHISWPSPVREKFFASGATFTKNIVYLDGLLRVHNFLRTLVAVGHTRLRCGLVFYQVKIRSALPSGAA